MRWFDENNQLVTVAMIEPFVYSNNSRAVATDREVNGYNTTKATIDSPPDPWLSASGPIAQRRFLHLETEVIPALDVGQKAQQRTLIEIDERDILQPGDDLRWRDVADTWGRELIDDLKRKTELASAAAPIVLDGKALALEILAHGAPVNRLTIKYPDATDPRTACYQALVHTRSTITSIQDIREIDSPIHVRLHQHPGHPLAQVFGLKVKCMSSREGEVVDILQPVRPFWMHLAVKEELGIVACFRSVAGPWTIIHPWFQAQTGVEKTATVGGPALRPMYARTGRTRVGTWLAKLPKLRDSPGCNDDLGTVIVNNKYAAREFVYAFGLSSSGTPLSPPPWPSRGPDLHIDLKHAADRWLRTAITNEFVELSAELGNDPARGKFVTERLSEHAAWKIASIFIDKLCNTECVYRLCGSYSTDQLIEISNMAGLVLSDQDNAIISAKNTEDIDQKINEESNEILEAFGDLDAWIDGVSAAQLDVIQSNQLENIVGWKSIQDIRFLKYRLQWSMAFVNKYSVENSRASVLMLPEDLKVSLRSMHRSVQSDSNVQPMERNADGTIANNWAWGTIVKFDKIVGLMQNIEEAVNQLLSVLLDWADRGRWERLTHDQAVKTICNMTEIQLVIDDILSNQWEDQSKRDRTFAVNERNPTEFIPAGKDIDLIGKEEGLAAWLDPLTRRASRLWVAPLAEPVEAIEALDGCDASLYDEPFDVAGGPLFHDPPQADAQA